MNGEASTVRLGDVVSVAKGITYKGSDLVDDNAEDALLSITSIAPQGGWKRGGLRPFCGRHKDVHRCHTGDIVMALTDLTQDGTLLGSVARVPSVRTGLVASHHVARIYAAGDGIHLPWLRWRFAMPDWRRRAASHATGTTVRQFKTKVIEEWELSLPPLVDQVQVADALDLLENKVDANRRLAALLEETAATLFRGRFLDFVGVTDFVDSEIGPVPRGWQVVPVSELLEVNPRVPLKKGRDAPFIEMAAVDPWQTRPSRVGARPYSGGARFEPGDTLLARITGCIEHGKGAFVDFLDEPGSGSTEWIVLRARPPLPAEAAFLLSRNAALRSHLIAQMTGSSGRQRVPTDAFRSFKLAVPPDAEVFEELAPVLTAAFEKSRALWNETKTVVDLRDTLLPKLVSGELRIPEREEVIASL